MKPLVSILIPCFNAEPYLAATLESILAQTWSNIEIIVVNDGSTDGSALVLKTFASRGVKIIHCALGSAAKARNRAFQECTGAYIKFFDADDLLSPETIERQIMRLEKDQSSVASSEWGRFYHNDLSSFQLSEQSVWRDMDGRDWLVDAWKLAEPMMQPGLYLIPRALLERTGLWDERLTLIDDFEFFARVLCHANKVRFTPGARLFYRSGLKNSLSQRTSRLAVESAYHSLLDGTASLLRYRADKEARLSCANVLQNFVYTYYPDHGDLLRDMSMRVLSLGGTDLAPSGPPNFHRLRRFMGWKLARRVQRFAYRHGYILSKVCGRVSVSKDSRPQ